MSLTQFIIKFVFDFSFKKNKYFEDIYKKLYFFLLFTLYLMKIVKNQNL